MTYEIEIQPHVYQQLYDNFSKDMTFQFNRAAASTHGLGRRVMVLFGTSN